MSYLVRPLANLPILLKPFSSDQAGSRRLGRIGYVTSANGRKIHGVESVQGAVRADHDDTAAEARRSECGADPTRLEGVPRCSCLYAANYQRREYHETAERVDRKRSSYIRTSVSFLRNQGREIREFLVIQGRKRGARVRLGQVRATRSCSPARMDQSCPLTSAIAELERNYSSRGAAIAIWRRALSDHVTSPELIAARIHSSARELPARTVAVTGTTFSPFAASFSFRTSDYQNPKVHFFCHCLSSFAPVSHSYKFAILSTSIQAKKHQQNQNQSTERAIKTEQPALFCNS